MPIRFAPLRTRRDLWAGLWALAIIMAPPGALRAADPEEAYVPSGVPLSETVTGSACVIDGDTLMVNATKTRGRCLGGTVVHLLGVDAPELRQQCQDRLAILVACGRQARTILTAKARGAEVTCQTRKLAKGLGQVGECYMDGENLNAFMVRLGWAAVVPAAQRRYLALERAAQTEKRGIWRLNMMMPWEWRNRPS